MGRAVRTNEMLEHFSTKPSQKQATSLSFNKVSLYISEFETVEHFSFLYPSKEQKLS